MKPSTRISAARRAGRRHAKASFAGMALAIAALHTPAAAADHIWKGNWGYWDDANEWTLLGLPGTSDSAQLAAGATWLTGSRNVGSLLLTGGRLWGDGSLTTGSLDFQKGALGGGGLANSYPTGFTTVTGAASFNGANTLSVSAGHTLTLLGASTWTAGSGSIKGSPYGGTIVNNASFSDLGTGTAGFGTDKSLLSDAASGGGSFINNGSYVRSGAGITRAYGFENNGTLQVQSGMLQMRGSGTLAGTTVVSAGAELAFYESSAVISGNVNNLGLASFDRGNVLLTGSASINGAVKVSGGIVQNNSVNSLTALELNGGQITGSGTWTTTSLDFQRGTLGGGGITNSYPTGFTAVTGTASFNGANTLSVAAGHTLTLHGASTWAAGNGALGGGGTVANAAGAVFIDQGTAAANASKALRDSGGTYNGGSFINDGIYVRSGLGSTKAYGFSNAGLLQLRAGSFAVDEHFSNVGEVRIEAGAVLESFSSDFNNNGLISGIGTIRTASLSQSLVNTGTLTPGGIGTAGSLLLEGDLTMAGSGVLRIDLETSAHDLLIVTSDATFAGTLQLWVDPMLTLHQGDSFVVATYGQRLAGSTFSSVQWLGGGANPFSVEYGDNALTLRVTAAVPEPQAWALWLLGASALAAWRKRRPKPALD